MQGQLRAAMLILSIASSTPIWTGCQTKTVAIAADRNVIYMKANEPFTPTAPGYYVPSATMLQILNRLDAAALK